jgi:hypothetical protein
LPQQDLVKQSHERIENNEKSNEPNIRRKPPSGLTQIALQMTIDIIIPHLYRHNFNDTKNFIFSFKSS